MSQSRKVKGRFPSGSLPNPRLHSRILESGVSALVCSITSWDERTRASTLEDRYAISVRSANAILESRISALVCYTTSWDERASASTLENRYVISVRYSAKANGDFGAVAIW